MFDQSELTTLAETACRACGASAEMARSLARASVSADAAGRHEVGLAHLLDHLASLKEGRIRGDAVPVIASPAGAAFVIDARDGVAQLGFDMVFEDLVARTRAFGLALVTQHACYPAAELGYFARRLAEAGLIGLAAGNAHALMAVAAGGGKVFSTNPLAFAAPVEDAPPLVIDQASAATAYVNILRAAETGRPLPEGWALDAHRQPTTDAQAAKLGALLPFGGYKGANVALMVEVLVAGLAGGAWSMDTGHFTQGDQPPGAGMIVLAISPALYGPDFQPRLKRQLDRLASEGVHLPGRALRRDGQVEVAAEVVSRIKAFAQGA